MSKEELEIFLKGLKYGDIVTISQDLSGGEMIESMISTSVREYSPKTRLLLTETLKRDTILKVSKREYW